MVTEKMIKKIEELEKRIVALESAQIVVSAKPVSAQKKANFSGPKGGITMLLKKGFFRNKRSTDEVKAALDKEGYIYIRQVVQTALNRLSKKNGLLVNMIEKGIKVYVERK